MDPLDRGLPPEIPEEPTEGGWDHLPFRRLAALTLETRSRQQSMKAIRVSVLIVNQR
jgi:hypothetical protein